PELVAGGGVEGDGDAAVEVADEDGAASGGRGAPDAAVRGADGLAHGAVRGVEDLDATGLRGDVEGIAAQERRGDDGTFEVDGPGGAGEAGFDLQPRDATGVVRDVSDG